MVLKYIKKLVRFLMDLFANLIGLFSPSQQRYLPPITDRLLIESATTLTERIKSGKLSCEELMKAYIDRIKTVQPHINAVIDERFADAILEAIEVDKRVEHELSGNAPLNGVSIKSQPLLGIPFSGKDSVAIKGLNYTSGSYLRKGIKATEDSSVAILLKNAGAIPVCMTNVPEMLMWWDVYNKLYGKTHNPYDKSIITGGSTGGNASLISSAASVIGVAGDIGGSTRIPSFFCGIFGHCITPELVPTDNHYPPFPEQRLKLLSYGPMCRYATDLRPTVKAYAGLNANQLNLDDTVDISKLKVYYMYGIDEPSYTPLSSDLKRVLTSVVHHLESKGAVVKQVSFKQMNDAFEIWMTAMKTVDARTYCEEFTNRTGTLNPYLELLRYVCGVSVHTLPAIMTCIIEKFGPSDEEVTRINRIREELRAQMYDMLGNDGVLLFPPHPEPGVKVNTTLLKYKNCAYTGVFNALRVSMTQVPLGLNKKGLPLGVQVIAKPFNDNLTISVAEELEAKFGGWVPPTRIIC